MTLYGCRSTETIETNIVKASGSEVFEGSMKKLEPHLGLITGCANIEYKGEKQFIACKYEIWENGNITESTDVFSSRIDGGFEGDVSVSLKQLRSIDLELSQDMIMTTAIGDEKGYNSSTSFVKRFSENFGYSPYVLTDEIIATDDDEISIWGLMANAGSSYSQEDSIEATAKDSDWAMVLKVYFTE